jgi:acyl-CoA thioesterase-1
VASIAHPYGPGAGLRNAAIVLFCLMFSGVAQAAPLRLLLLGDSLGAGYGLAHDESFQVQLLKALRAGGHDVVVLDGAVSGDTSAGGLARLDWALGDGADAAIVELGGNDGLRGLPVSRIEANLGQIVTKSRAAGAEVLLLAVQVPTNYGPQYTASFQKVYADLGKRYEVGVAPLMGPSIALDLAYFLPDGIHPNAKAQPLLLANVWPKLAPLLGPQRP